MVVLNRRRFLSICAASAALPAGMARAETAAWRGRALGAGASMQIVGMDSGRAAPVFAALEAELERLERVFSLYRDSELTALNRDGRLAAPSVEMLEVLRLADSLNRATMGAFDPSVQPLWQALALGGDVAVARARVGWQAVRFDAQAVVLEREGMALTLNGIAQGYVTDRVVALLRAQGLRDVLVDMGEIAALGHRADGAPWGVGVAAPDGQIVARLKMSDRALATSAVDGTMLGGETGHILHPAGGAPAQRLVSVSAPRAAVADGLSTALCLMGREAGLAAVAQFAGARIEAVI